MYNGGKCPLPIRKMTLRKNCLPIPESSVQRRVSAILTPFNPTCYLPSGYYNVDNIPSISEFHKLDRVCYYSKIRVFLHKLFFLAP